MTFRLVVAFAASLLFATIPAAAQDVEEMTLEELLDQELKIAAMKGTTARESPGIVTLITAEEIADSGARDLIDVLRMVPGFDFGVDVQGIVGIGVRGNWAHEGKLLLLLDGQEMNEPLYSTLQFGNRIPVEQIARVEVIRGPGSAIYGGYAELGVVNVITRSADMVNGFEAWLVDGEMSGANARRRIALSAASLVGGQRSFVAHASLGSGNRSDALYTDANGESFDMEDNAELDTANINLAAMLGNFSLRAIYDRYDTTERDHFGENLPHATEVNFDSWFVEASWLKTIGTRAWIIPRINFKQQKPWNERDEFFFYDKEVQRLTANVTASFDPTSKVNLVGGAEFFEDHASVGGGTDPADYFPGGKRSISYQTFALFAQGMFDTPVAKVTIGARYEDNSEFGTSFVPRIGLTRIIGPFHFKGLAARAFRAPGIENIRLGSDIQPEKTTVYEFEAGYQINDSSFVTANLFSSEIRRPIVYFVDPDTEEEGYANFDETGTEGLELEYRMRGRRGYLNLGYSFYRANDEVVASYAVPDHDNHLLAFPTQKMTALGSLRLGDDLRIAPSLIVYGKRYGYDSSPGETLALREFDTEYLLNINASRKNFLRPGVTLSAGVFDLLDEGHRFIQPYDAGHPSLPDASREFIVRVGYEWRRN
jgi:outer membrane receptor for ferrienterochelin and colicins